MSESLVPLTALSEAQRAQALERYTIIRPALEEGASQAQVARTHQIATSTIQLWMKRYREKGLAGLANNVARSDKGKSRGLPPEAIQLIEGLALQTPPRSAAPIHRQGGRPIIPSFLSCCSMKQGSPPSPGSPRLKMTTAG